MHDWEKMTDESLFSILERKENYFSSLQKLYGKLFLSFSLQSSAERLRRVEKLSKGILRRLINVSCGIIKLFSVNQDKGSSERIIEEN